MCKISSIQNELGVKTLINIFNSSLTRMDAVNTINSRYSIPVSLITIKRLMKSINYNWKEEHAKIRKEIKASKQAEIHNCEYCGKECDKSYGSGRFCSEECSRKYSSFINKDQKNRNISKAFSLKPKNLSKRRLKWMRSFSKKWLLKDKNKIKNNFKITSSNDKIPNHKDIKIKRSPSIETRLKQSTTMKRLWAEGKLKGWPSRNKHKRSYAEAFWEKVLQNNGIPYEYEKKVSKKSLGITGSGNYFLDFLLPNNIDLEIDGGQHDWEDRKAHDKVRDEALTSNGFIVYRIRFINPKGDENKRKVKEQIDKFIEWYNSKSSLQL